MSNAKTFQEWAKEILPIVQAAANGEPIQGRFSGRGSKWYDVEPDWEVFRRSGEYRIKPKTIRIGEYDVPEPARDMPDIGTVYFIPNLGNVPICSCTWLCHLTDIDRFNNGLIHLCADNAALHAKALLSITEVRL